jgi:hypothetical protein
MLKGAARWACPTGVLSRMIESEQTRKTFTRRILYSRAIADVPPMCRRCADEAIADVSM